MKKAFTLIELLVVIAIIAILAALLMPALARAREEAQKTRCRSSVHNVGIAFQLFTNDHDGVYPGWVGKRQSSNQSVADEAANDPFWTDTWPEAKPYVRSTDGGPYYQLIDQGYAGEVELFDCPSCDNPTWGQWSGPSIVGTTAPDTKYPDPTQNNHLGDEKKIEFAEYGYDLGRTSRNSVAGRIFYGDNWGRRHQWSSSWGWWPYNHDDGANAVSVDQAVVWCPREHSDTLWSSTPDVSRGFLHNTQTLYTGAGNWDRAGWVPNPRMDEDVQRFDTYVRNGVGGLTDEQQLLPPEDLDDIYAIEGWSGWGSSDPWRFSYAGDPTVAGGGGGSGDAWNVSARFQPHLGTAEPKSWWGGARGPAYWSSGMRWHPEIGPFANEGRWDTHDARLLPVGMHVAPK